jgi:hypothetical protein
MGANQQGGCASEFCKVSSVRSRASTSFRVVELAGALKDKLHGSSCILGNGSSVPVFSLRAGAVLDGRETSQAKE